MKPNIEAFFEPVTATISYIVYDEPGGACAIIDSVLDYDPKAGRTSTDFCRQADRVYRKSETKGGMDT